MNVLVAGYSRDQGEALSVRLRAAGHRPCVGSGRSACRTFAQAVPFDAVLVPPGRASEVGEWLAGLVDDVPRHGVAPGSTELPRALVRAVGEGAGPTAPTSAEAAPGRPLSAAEPTSRGEPVAASDSAPSSAEPAPVAQPPARVRGGARRGVETVSPPPPHDPEAGDRLRRKLEHVRFGDYFAILECTPTCTAEDARAAAERLRARFAPEGWPGHLDAPTLDGLAEVARGLDDAQTLLTDPTLAARYRAARGRRSR